MLRSKVPRDLLRVSQLEVSFFEYSNCNRFCGPIFRKDCSCYLLSQILPVNLVFYPRLSLYIFLEPWTVDVTNIWTTMLNEASETKNQRTSNPTTNCETQMK